MFFFERNKDFAVHRPDGSCVTQGNIDTAVREADVIEDDVDLLITYNLTNGCLDVCKIFLCSLDARSRRSSHMKPHLSRIHLWKEVSSQHWKEEQGHHHKGDEEDDRYLSIRQRP